MFAVCIEDKHHISPLMSAGGFEKEEGNLKSLLQVRWEPPGQGMQETAVRPVMPLPQQSSLTSHRGEERRGDWQDLKLPFPPPLAPTAAAWACLHQALRWHIGAGPATAKEYSAKVCCRGVVRKEVYGRGHQRANSGPLYSSQGTLQKSCLNYNSSWACSRSGGHKSYLDLWHFSFGKLQLSGRTSVLYSYFTLKYLCQHTQ